MVAAMKSRTLAVTGGTGFVGQHLLRIALASGYEVRALTRTPRPADPGRARAGGGVGAPGGSVAWVGGALDRSESLKQLCEGADAVIHIAGLITGDRTAFEAVNVTG